jgi:hypothetical protein
MLHCLCIQELPEHHHSSRTLMCVPDLHAMQGSCVGVELDGIILDPPAPSIGQCSLTTNTSVFELSNISSELLLSDVYIRLNRTATQQASFVTLLAIKSGSAWITTTVFRGDRIRCRAVDIGRGQNLHARSVPLPSHTVMLPSPPVSLSDNRQGRRQCT